MSVEAGREKPTKRWPYLLIAAVILSTALPDRNAFFSTDEGLYYLEAQRMLRGEIPYRDFFQFIGPGTMSLARAVMAVFGDDALAAMRFLLLGLYGLSASLLYSMALRRVGRPLIALLAPLYLIVVSHQAAWWSYDHHALSNTLILIALALLFQLLDRPRRWTLAALGLACGASVTVTQHIGALLTLAVLGLAAFVLPHPLDRSRRDLVRPILIGASVLPILALLYLADHGAVGDAYQSMVVWPLTDYRRFHDEPYFSDGFRRVAESWSEQGLGAFTAIGHLLLVGIGPPLALVFGVLRLLVRRPPPLPGEDARRSAAGVALVVLACVQFAAVGAHPAQYVIARSSTLAFIVLLELVSPGRSRLARAIGERLPGLGPSLRRAFSLLLIAWLAWDLAGTGRRAAQTQAEVRAHAFRIPTRFGELLHPDRAEGYELNLVLREILARTKPSDPILVFHWSSHFYVLADRPPAVPYSGILPGYSEPQLARFAEAVARGEPRLVVRDRVVDALIKGGDPRLKELRVRGPYLGPIDMALMAHYKPVLLLRHFSVFARK
ncbi:MAG: hypothetical protein IT384_06680 [Deltaproteobacteria bacterium]|nr:hypothetical protein [Deltaproteobacteria bacterium]